MIRDFEPRTPRGSSSSDEYYISPEKLISTLKTQGVETKKTLPVRSQQTPSRAILLQPQPPEIKKGPRWIKNTQNMKKFVKGLLIEKLILPKLIHNTQSFYLCDLNLFCLQCPKVKHHQWVKKNPLNFLLKHQERKKIQKFKKRLMTQNRYLSGEDLKLLLEVQLKEFIEKEFELKKLKTFVEGLPRIGEYFQLPFMVSDAAEDFTDPCSSALTKRQNPFKAEEDLEACGQQKQKQLSFGGEFLIPLKIEKLEGNQLGSRKMKKLKLEGSFITQRQVESEPRRIPPLRTQSQQQRSPSACFLFSWLEKGRKSSNSDLKSKSASKTTKKNFNEASDIQKEDKISLLENEQEEPKPISSIPKHTSTLQNDKDSSQLTSHLLKDLEESFDKLNNKMKGLNLDSHNKKARTHQTSIKSDYPALEGPKKVVEGKITIIEAKNARSLDSRRIYQIQRINRIGELAIEEEKTKIEYLKVCEEIIQLQSQLVESDDSRDDGEQDAEIEQIFKQLNL